MAYSMRYEIDLGRIDLSKPGRYRYKMSGLPLAEFNVGIEVIEMQPNEIGGERPEHPTQIQLELRTAEGEIVILEESSLNSWVWSFARDDTISHLYQRGESREILLPNGNTISEQMNVKASGGWGTYFESEHDKEYFLEFQVVPSVRYIDRPARLIVNGWDR